MKASSGNESYSQIRAELGASTSSPIHTSLPPSGPQSSKQESETSENGENKTAAAPSEKETSGAPSSRNTPSSRNSIDSRTSEGGSSDSDEPESEGSGSRDTETIGSTNGDTDESGKGCKETTSSDKEDKKSLRKGKWAVEEEEYTSRVIQHFSAGLLTLPDGATLRSYLAEKLNCDPMRITKKFTGACCLGRRVYHLRDRPRATPTELEMAKAERDHLERRFRLRIEHEQSGLPLSRRRDMLLAQPQGNLGTIYPMQNFSAGNALSPWLNNLGVGLGRGAQATLPLSGNQGFLSSLPSQLSSSILQQNASRWLLPGAAETMVANASGQTDPSIQLLNNLVTSWAVAQAAASISPGTLASFPVGSMPTSSIKLQQQQPLASVAERSQLQPNLDLQLQLRNAYEEQRKEEEQRQLRAAFEEVKKKKEEKDKADAAAATAASAVVVAPAAVAPVAAIETKAAGKEVSPAELLQKSYLAHLQSLEKVANNKGQKVNARPKVDKGTKKGDGNEQPMADEEAGTVLLGFLNSLRQSYEDAIEEKAGKPVVEHPKKSKTEPTIAPKTTKGLSSSSTSIKQNEDKPRSTVKGGVKRSQVSISNHRSPQSDEQAGNNLSSVVSQFMTSSAARRSLRPASVTDTSSGNSSSQHAEFSSSIEDSSDKTDPSSSEESEKDDRTQRRRNSKGPPRKRLKSFTAENLIAHSKRMSEGAGD